MRYFLISWYIAILFPFLCPAQETKSLEAWLDLIQEDASIAELLQDLQENPVEVNTATKADWQRIPLLSEATIEKILKIRRQKGAFKSIRQLKTIVGAEWYRRIRPFVVLNLPTRHYFYWLQRNYRTIEHPQANYSGNNLYNLTKVRVKYDERIDGGIVTQKDIGESQWTDYLNGYIRFTGKKIHFILGSFYLQFGQGLLFSSPFGGMKSTLVTLPFTSNKDRAAAYFGSAENFAQTGLFGQFQYSAQTTIRFAFSRTLRDGRFNSLTKKIIGFDYTGYHRNPKEESKKDLISENMLLFNMLHRFSSRIHLGLLFARFIFTPSIAFGMPNISFSEQRRRYFHFKGHFLDLSSVYYRFEGEHITFAGEWALSDFKRAAFNQTLFVREKNTRFGVLFWQLNRNFQTLFGRVFDDHAPFPGAQQGIYAAFTYDHTLGAIRFYKLIKKDLWRSYLDPMPLLHDEWLTQMTLRFSTVKLKIRLRHRFNEEFLSDSQSQPERVNLSHTALRVEAGYGSSKNIRLRTRLEWCNVAPLKEKGILMFQGIRIRWTKKLQTNMRLTFFRTRSYASRIYEYEYDVPGSFANIALYGQGFKWYLQVNWRISRFVRIWLKYRYLILNERNFNTIDYGKIKRPLQRLIRLQFEVRL